MLLSQVPYIAYLNPEFLRQVHADADQVLWLIRHSSEKLDSWMWEANESVVRRDRVDEEGLDCLGMPFGRLGIDMFVIEAVPYPKGYLRMSIRGRMETVCHHQGQHTILIKSDVVNAAPQKTAKEMGMMKVTFEDDPLKRSDR